MKTLFFSLFSLYPPFLGAGIRIKISRDVKTVTVRMKKHFWNKNYVGTHYGGSLYSMCDPFFFFLLYENLGRDYIVWDKGASITFKKPGKSTVTATFFITEEKYDQLRKEIDKLGKINPVFSVDILDESGEVVATVEKLMHLRKKNIR